MAVVKNWCANPSAETDVSIWSPAEVTVTRDTGTAYVGAASFKLTVATLAIPPRIYWGADSGNASRVPITPGQTIAVSYWVKSSRAVKFGIDVKWRQSDGLTQVGATVTSTMVTASTTAWTQVTIGQQTAPATTAYVAIELRWELNSSPVIVGDFAYFDAIDFRIDGAYDSYIDGSLGPGYAWLGTANLSTSTRSDLRFGPYVGPSLSQLTTTKIGGGEAVRTVVTGVQCSWQVDSAGSLSCTVAAKDARLSGVSTWYGRWVRYDHPTAGSWGGRITQPRWRPGVLELGCESFHTLLRKRRVPIAYQQQGAQAGALALRAITDVQHDEHFFLNTATADEDSDLLSFDWQGGDLYDDVLRQLSGDATVEWRVDENRNFTMRQRLGRDKTDSVHLIYGRHFTDYDLSGDLWTIENDILGIPDDRDFQKSVQYIREDASSIATYGRLQSTRTFPNLITRSTIRIAMMRLIAKTKDPAEVLSLTTVDADGIWERIRDGDTVRVTIGEANISCAFRIGVRVLDVDAGTLSLTGIIEARL